MFKLTTTVTTTYTVIDPQGEVLERGLSTFEAAQVILTYDGRDYELRPASKASPTMWNLYSKRQNRLWEGPCWTGSAGDGGRLICGWGQTEGEAWDEIAAQVLTASWGRHPSAMPDADYDAQVAEWKAEAAETEGRTP